MPLFDVGTPSTATGAPLKVEAAAGVPRLPWFACGIASR